MPDKFDIEFELDLERNSDENVALLRESISLVDDACDCGGKGVILCQIYPSENGTHMLVSGKFIDYELSKKIVAMTLEE